MNLFSKIFSQGESSSVIGVDIGSSALKVVQLRKKNGQAVLETYGALALGPYANLSVGQSAVLPNEKVAQALVDLMKEKEVNITTNQSGLSIPFASSLMSLVEMPEVSQKQLAVMVPLEARKFIPVPVNEVMLDWSVIPKSGARPASADGLPKVDVLVVAIHRETINKYQDIVTKAGLETSFFEIEIFSTMRSVLDESLKPVMIMDLGASSTKLYIVERGVVRASHTVNRGSQDITLTMSKSLGITPEEAEVLKRRSGAVSEDQSVNDIARLVLDYIFAEANSTLLNFEKKHNKTISKVVLVGGGASLKGLTELAKENLKTEAELANPFSKVAAPAFLENVLKETGPEFAVAIGLALRKLAEQG